MLFLSEAGKPVNSGTCASLKRALMHFPVLVAA